MQISARGETPGMHARKASSLESLVQRAESLGVAG